jgi:hypothetical protein
METSGIRFRRRWSPRKTVILLALAALLTLGFGGPALGAADGGHGEGDHGGGAKGWVATDTYRVMNFGVLAIALFFLLRKPVSKALNARIEGIKEELADLEGRKQKAEKELPTTSESFPPWTRRPRRSSPNTNGRERRPASESSPRPSRPPTSCNSRPSGTSPSSTSRPRPGCRRRCSTRRFPKPRRSSGPA